MLKIENTIIKLDEKVLLCQELYAKKQIFLSGIDVLDQKVGPFSKNKRYLFLASPKNGLAPLYRTIVHNTRLIYQENVATRVLFFKHASHFNANNIDHIPDELKANFDIIIVLQLEKYQEIISLDSGKHTEAFLNFTVIKPNGKPKNGQMILNPNTSRVWSQKNHLKIFKHRLRNLL
uniref:hypothetical protein n=1 Tax=Flavobacterium sp. TaxID=239 RepID=UPI00404A8A6B